MIFTIMLLEIKVWFSICISKDRLKGVGGCAEKNIPVIDGDFWWIGLM